jgi:hypothetical protein
MINLIFGIFIIIAVVVLIIAATTTITTTTTFSFLTLAFATTAEQKFTAKLFGV